MKNLHEIYPNFHVNADNLKPHFYIKSFTDTPLMAMILISASNTTRTNNNSNMKNLHDIYPNFHINVDNLKPYSNRKSFSDTHLMATIVISSSNTTRNNNNIDMKNLHEIYPNFHLHADILKPHFYMKSFTDTPLMATIVISVSNIRNNNNMDMENLHKIYPNFHLHADILKPHIYMKSFTDTL